MRALFDVNVLIALLDAQHVGHASARRWLGGQLDAGWASCPITQNGAVRVMSSQAYPNPLPVKSLAERLAAACGRKHHEFWPDELSIVDTAVFDHLRILGPKQLTDRYLLALAVARGGRLVTFDRAIQTGGVRGAAAHHLLCIDA
jgi:uncharacterized protein